MTTAESGGANQPERELHRCADAGQAARTAARVLAERARKAVVERGSFTLAVSGGRSPWVMLAELAALDMPWEQTTIFQVDERIGGPEDPLRNLHGLRAALPEGCPAVVVPMPVEAADLAAAAHDYAAGLPEQFDVIHLGLGADGHTASLIPGDPVLEVSAEDVALTGVYQARRRMTLTYPRIARADTILWLVTGADKVAALAQLRDDDPAIPATGIRNANQILVYDAAAEG